MKYGLQWRQGEAFVEMPILMDKVISWMLRPYQNHKAYAFLGLLPGGY
jgi:hypothetical protein